MLNKCGFAAYFNIDAWLSEFSTRAYALTSILSALRPVAIPGRAAIATR
jgi:hypothetical protein